MTSSRLVQVRFGAGFAGLLAAFAVGAAAEAPTAVQWPDAGEQAAIKAIAEQFDAVEGVSRNRDGSLKTVVLTGRGAKENASLRFTFDPDTQRVVAVNGNAVGVKNDEFNMFLPLTELKVLSLHHNSCDCDRELMGEVCDGSGIAQFKNSPALEEITLPGGPFDNDALAAVAALPQLKRLGIWHVRVDDAGFAALRNHPGLESVRISQTWSPDLTDKAIEHLSSCPNLKELRFNEGYVTWEHGLRHLTKLKGTFETLDVDKSVVAPEDLERFRREMPGVEVKHAGLPVVGQLIVDDFKGAARKLPTFVPQVLLDRYVAAAKAAE